MDTAAKPNYKKTLRACYLGFITQAFAANFAPLIFLKLHKDYQIPLGMIAQKAGDNLQYGLFFGGIFPVVLIVLLFILKFMKEKE